MAEYRILVGATAEELRLTSMIEYRILTGTTTEELAYIVQNEINGPEKWVLQGGVSAIIRQFQFHEPRYLFFQAVSRDVFRPSHVEEGPILQRE